jgi:hypothetical protein
MQDIWLCASHFVNDTEVRFWSQKMMNTCWMAILRCTEKCGASELCLIHDPSSSQSIDVRETQSKVFSRIVSWQAWNVEMWEKSTISIFWEQRSFTQKGVVEKNISRRTLSFGESSAPPSKSKRTQSSLPDSAARNSTVREHCIGEKIYKKHSKQIRTKTLNC